MSSKSRSDTDKPPFEPDDQLAYFTELGRALSYWASVEAALAEAYATSVNPHKQDAALVGFWTIVSFEAKRKLADAAVLIALESNLDLREKWTRLSRLLKSKGTVRSNLAHGVVVTDGDKRETYLAIRYYQHRHNIAEKQKSRRPKSQMSLKQIVKERQDFAQLRRDLWEFSDELRDHIFAQANREQGTVIQARTARLLLDRNQTPQDN